MEHPKQSTQSSVVAVFDFDGTMTRQDTLLPFLKTVMGRWRFWWGILTASPILAGYGLKLIPNWQAKETLLVHLLAGQTEKYLCAIAEQFAVTEISQQLRPEAVRCLRRHQEQKHITLLISASLEIYLLPWAKIMGFDRVAGTQLVVRDGCLTGRILGNNCYGPEKVKRLQALLGDLNEHCIYAYGDSKGDRELLNIANFPYYRTFVSANRDRQIDESGRDKKTKKKL